MLQIRRFLIDVYKRQYSRNSSRMILHDLKNRGLIQASGKDVSDFLQGLITNDMNHLSGGPGSMFTMFLNSNGRVLYDSIIYKTTEQDTYLIECDIEGLRSLEKHLKIYRVRRKVDFNNISDKYTIFAMLDPNIDLITSTGPSKLLDGRIVPCDKLNETMPNNDSTQCSVDVMIFKDPRIRYLGSRIIARKDYNLTSFLEKILGYKILTTEEKSYRKFRYMLGVGEGVLDLPPGNCFPLECNCDYLHGVSFHKGCYIGQELTARTHHTGVVRKRLMPLQFNKIPTKLPDDGKIIVEGVNMGKLRGIEENFGLGLLRIAKALELKEFNVGNGIASVQRPSWWPVEAPKERLGSQSG